MGVETATYISQLSATNPLGTDPVSEGDNQIRLVKDVLKQQFPNFTAATVDPTCVELNYVDGVTSAIQTQIDAKSATAGNTSLVTLGTITTGAWTATDVAVLHGGTGSSTASAARTALGVAIGSDVQAYDADTAKLDTAQEWTKTQNFNSTALSFDATQDWDLSANQVCSLTLTANTTFDAPTNQVDGAFYAITLIQDGTGGWTGSWNSVFHFAGGTAPTLTTTASAVDLMIFRSNGTNMLESGRQLDVKTP